MIEVFTWTGNDLKSLTLFATELHRRCLITPRYVSDKLVMYCFLSFFPLDFNHVLDIRSKFLNAKSSCSQMFFKIGFLKNFTIYTGKHLCWSLFLLKVFLLFSEYCKSFKNRFNIEYLLDAASTSESS